MAAPIHHSLSVTCQNLEFVIVLVRGIINHSSTSLQPGFGRATSMPMSLSYRRKELGWWRVNDGHHDDDDDDNNNNNNNDDDNNNDDNDDGDDDELREQELGGKSWGGGGLTCQQQPLIRSQRRFPRLRRRIR
ncbi:hypothetical protein Q1695_008039 [Nippostrongylus brasiliensis]|nr:hypothetical protein Q1695_008039 [Nippostrongylus brasiliensis]